MALESRLELKLSQKLVLTPQLQMAIKLLQMPQLELSQTLTQELVENPFLEESTDVITDEELTYEEKESLETASEKDDAEMPLEDMVHFASDDYFEERGADGRDLGYFTSGTTSQPSFEYFLGSSSDLYDHLLWQLRLSKDDEEIRTIGEIIIGNLDENGYLRTSLEEIMETAKTEQDKAEKALALVQGFDPTGVAARDIRECLHLQLKALNLGDTLMEKLVLNDLDMVGAKKYAQLSKTYNVPVDEILSAVKIIESLDPKPGRYFSTSAANYIIPDVYIIKTDDGYQILLNDEGLPRLRISNYYQKLLNSRNSIPKEDRQFLEDKLRSAVWLLKSLSQRNKTIYRVTENILTFQRDFFDHGIKHLKPLNLKDVATELSLHESTISRVTSNKYLSCPLGILSFKFFFSNEIPSEAGGVSSTSIKEMIKQLISEENAAKPLSDMHIVELLKDKKIRIARRTVAKYREELKIPPHNQRKKSNTEVPLTVKGAYNEHNH